MNKKLSDFGKVFDAFRNAIESLSDEQFEELVEGKGTFTYTLRSSKSSKKVQSSHPTMDELYETIDKLNLCQTRDDAHSLIAQIPYLRSREHLFQLARLLEIHINKRDKREEIENKIIEFVVGSRLRSSAIHGINLKRSR